ncbi:MAG: hypothetical protein VXY77_04910 [Pseudomonadota bacterium]|nr:hypothetical protein [Pseudomonadota bacterium]
MNGDLNRDRARQHYRRQPTLDQSIDHKQLSSRALLTLMKTPLIKKII